MGKFRVRVRVRVKSRPLLKKSPNLCRRKNEASGKYVEKKRRVGNKKRGRDGGIERELERARERERERENERERERERESERARVNYHGRLLHCAFNETYQIYQSCHTVTVALSNSLLSTITEKLTL